MKMCFFFLTAGHTRLHSILSISEGIPTPEYEQISPDLEEFCSCTVLSGACLPDRLTF